MLRALIVGFILGFALVAVLRVSGGGGAGPQLASAPTPRIGGAINHVRLGDWNPAFARQASPKISAIR